MRRPLLLLLALALGLRVTVVLLTADLPIGLDDMFQYDMLARSIVSGNGYRWYAQEDLARIQQYLRMEPPPGYDPRGIPTSFRPPLYPAFLALVYLIAGTGPRRFLAARLVQAVLGAGMVPLTAILGRRLGLPRRAALWAAAAAAVYPLLIIYPLALATENLYIPLLLLSLWAVLRAGEEGRPRDAAMAGLLLGLTGLTRSVITLFVPLAAGWVWLTSRPRWAGLRNGLLIVTGFLLLTIPWSVRNTLLHHEFHFVESSLGYDLYQGYHPDGTGTFNSSYSLDLVPILDDGERNRRGMEAFWSFVRADPGRIPYLMLRKFGHFWGLDRRAFQYFYSNGFFGSWPGWLAAGGLAILCLPFMLIAPAGLSGLALASPHRKTGLIGLLFIYYVGVHMLILAEPRFHMPLVPLLTLYAFAPHPWTKAARWQRALAVLLILALAGNWGWELARDWDLLRALVGPGGSSLYLGY